MTTENTTNPNEIDETKLDEISGGPHYRIFHRVGYAFQSSSDTETTKTDLSAAATNEPVAYDLCDPIFRRVASGGS